MSKAKPKKAISFRIEPELYAKFRSYCTNNKLSQTEVFETWIELLNTNTTTLKEPVSLISLLKRVEALEAKLSKPGTPKQANRSTPKQETPKEGYYTSREVAELMGWRPKDTSRNLQRKKLTPVTFGGQAHYWDKKQVDALLNDH